MNFKLLFPTGYKVPDELNYNIDMHVILENGDVYFGMIYTIANVQYYLNKDPEPYFWSIDMLIVKDLRPATLKTSVRLLIDDRLIDKVFSKIGRVGENELYDGCSYDSLIDMGTSYLS